MTILERLCDPQRFEDALLEIKTTLDTVAGSAVAHEAFRRLHATIAERDGQIAALVEAANTPCRCERWECSQPTCGEIHEKVCARCKLLAYLSEAAAAHDERLKAEAAVEALRPIPCSCRTIGTTSEDATVITCLRCRAWSYYKSEAARLREEAGR